MSPAAAPPAVPIPSAQIITFPVRPRPFPTLGLQTEMVASVLMAFEDAPLTRPIIFGARDPAGSPFVAVRLGDRHFVLNIHDAGLTADALDAEQAFPGCSGLAAELRAAANAAVVRRPGDALTPAPRHEGRTGLGVMIALSASAVFWLAVTAIQRLAA